MLADLPRLTGEFPQFETRAGSIWGDNQGCAYRDPKSPEGSDRVGPNSGRTVES